MPIVVGTPEPAQWKILVDSEIEVDRVPLMDARNVVVPYNSAHYRLPEWRMRNGWPVEVPKFDVRAVAITSCAGEQTSYRPHPAQITTDASMRWIASSTTFDETTLRWHPSVGHPGWTWNTSAEHSPSLVSAYSYRVGREILLRSGLNFSSTSCDHLWSAFSGSMSSMTGFSLIFVVSMSASSSKTVPTYSTLIAPGHPTEPGPDEWSEEVSGSSFALQLRGNTIFASADQADFRSIFSVAPMLERTAPGYVGITVDYPWLSIYAGTSSGSLLYTRIDISDEPNALNWVIGRSTGSLRHGADMTLFEVGLYTDPLTKAQMVAQVATLAGSYGSS